MKLLLLPHVYTMHFQFMELRGLQSRYLVSNTTADRRDASMYVIFIIVSGLIWRQLHLQATYLHDKSTQSMNVVRLRWEVKMENE